MKYKYFILTVILLITGSILTGCESNRGSKENAKEEVQKADQALKDSQAQFDNEWQQFKNEAESKIENNEKRINDFKAEMKKSSEKFKAKYANKVLTLEQKNIELKKMINSYRYEGKDNWDNFKLGFSSNMDSVGNELNDIFSKKD
jgi:exonuclease VII large subunit